VVERRAVPPAGVRGELSGDLCRTTHPRVSGKRVGKRERADYGFNVGVA
jgi:hypothetical protein